MHFELPKNTESYPDELDAKRLRTWLETVPPEIRRLEYDFYKARRHFLHARKNDFENKQRVGKFTRYPAFTKEQQDDDWEMFQESFLRGGERKERFSEIIKMVKKDLPELLLSIPSEVKEKIQLIALTGSSIVGPRKSGQFLSDFDINFLIKNAGAEENFEVFPPVKESGVPYHLRGTGYADESRGKDYNIHWLLLPYFPIESSIPKEELKTITQNLVGSTLQRLDDIRLFITNMEKNLESKRESRIIS